MRPIAPASTTSSPTSTRSASRPTVAAPASAAGSSPRSAPPCAAASRSPATTRSTTGRCSGALAEACRRGGVTFVEETVVALAAGPELVLADGHRLGPDHVVLAAGTGLTAIDGLAGAALPPLRPVKGHILRLGLPGHGRPAAVPHGARPRARALRVPRPASRRLRRRRRHRRGAGHRHRGAGRRGARAPLRRPGDRPRHRRARAARGIHRAAARHAGQHAVHRLDRARRGCWRPSATTATASSWRRSRPRRWSTSSDGGA